MIAVYRIQKRFRRLAAEPVAAKELIWRPSEWPPMLHWGLTEVMGQLIEFQVAGCSVTWQVAGGGEDPMVAWQLASHGAAWHRPLAWAEQDQMVRKPLVEHELTGAAQGSQQTLDATAGAHVEGWPFSLWEQVWVPGLAKHHPSTLEE